MDKVIFLTERRQYAFLLERRAFYSLIEYKVGDDYVQEYITNDEYEGPYE